MKTREETIKILEKILGRKVGIMDDRLQLQCSDLRNANLSNTDLRDADLMNVDLSDTNLCQSNLHGVAITSSQIKYVLKAMYILVISDEVGTIKIINGKKYMITDDEDNCTFGSQGILYKKIEE